MSDNCLDRAANADVDTSRLTLSSDPRESWLAKHAGHAVKTIDPMLPGAATSGLECADCAVAFAN